MTPYEITIARRKQGYSNDDLIEDVEWMFITGESPAMAAHRVGMSASGLTKRLRRAGRGDLASWIDRACRKEVAA